MAYSETYGNQVFNVQTFIDHGARRAGKLAEELTSEQIVSARESLFMILQSLINIGIQYWAVDKKVYGLNPDQFQYLLPVGGNDVLNALYRTMNRPTPNSTGGYSASSGQVANAFDNNIETVDIQTSPNGNIAIDFGTDNSVYAGSIGISPGVSGDFHILLEVSNDGSTWTTLYDCGVETWVDYQWLWYDIDPGATMQYYRMRETGGNTLQVREFYVGNMSRQIPMARLNRDDYTNLPNQNFTANQPYQFWFNRTIPQATINLWPVPDNPFVQMVVWYSRQIMDVGDLTNELEIPTRWYEAVQMMLSHRMALELPGVDVARITYLEDQAEKYLNQAEQEERDRSPIYYAPNIGVYTR